jgi:hypothetical protein
MTCPGRNPTSAATPGQSTPQASGSAAERFGRSDSSLARGLTAPLERARARLCRWLFAPRIREVVIVIDSPLGKSAGNRYGAPDIRPGGSPLGIDPFG